MADYFKFQKLQTVGDDPQAIRRNFEYLNKWMARIQSLITYAPLFNDDGDPVFNDDGDPITTRVVA